MPGFHLAPFGENVSQNAIGVMVYEDFLRGTFQLFSKKVGKLTFKKVIGPIAFPLRNEPGGAN